MAQTREHSVQGPEPKLYSTRTYLLLLVLVILAPVLFFDAILLLRVADGERHRIQQEARHTAEDIARDIERELTGIQQMLRAMALSPTLKDKDLRDFHAFAVAVARSRNGLFVLRDRDSRQLLNSAVQWGDPLPNGTSVRDTDQEALRTGGVAVSGVFVGLVVHRPLFSVVMPVERPADGGALLAISLPARQIRDVLESANLPHEARAAVLDRRGLVIASTTASEAEIARLAPDPGLDLSTEGERRNGMANTRSASGEPTVNFYQRTGLSDWTVVVSIPQATLDEPLRQSTQILFITGALVSLISLLGAWYAARRISDPMRAIARQAARATTPGAVGEPIDTRIREVRQVSEALSLSARELEARIAERDKAEASLRAFNATLEREVADRTAALTRTNQQLKEEMTRREQSESQVRQMQKIEAIGQLTGGIAHDFNNMLAIILGSLKLLERRLARGDTDVGRFSSAAIEGAERAAQLTRRLLAFSRQQSLSPAPLDLNRLVSGMSDMLRRTISESIDVETVAGGGLWKVHADANQLENALLNLAVNARDAMPDGGKLTIETVNAYLDERYAFENPDVKPGPYVLLAVTDNGCGMPEEVIRRAFDPFFTTKSPTQGTGLGLSQVHGFIKQSGGHVKIYSEPGHGTTIKIYLPRYYGDSSDSSGTSSRPSDASALPHGSETVLVVEDEEGVRAMSVEMLGELGYRVIAAPNAAAALALLGSDPGIDLLFTDVMMPEVNGRRLADEAVKLCPRLKVLFTTGYTRNAIVHNGILDPGVHLIVKPFSIEGLAAKLREVLDGA